MLSTLNSLTPCSHSLRVASKLPEANLLLLRELLPLLSNISRNVATSKMTAGNLAICLAPNLLSPPQELPLDVLALETGKVRCVHRPATASPAQPSFAAQRALAASSRQQSCGAAARKSSPTAALSCAETQVRLGKAVLSPHQPPQ